VELPTIRLGSLVVEEMLMGVTICLPLFGNPGHELEEGAAVKGQQLRELTVNLTERLQQAADALDRLAAAGWKTQLAMYDVLLFHEEVQTREQATARLQAVGVNPDELMIVEDVEDEEEPE
jgi:hypothetical protein